MGKKKDVSPPAPAAPKVELRPTVKLDTSSSVTLGTDAAGQGLSILPVLALVPQLEPFKVAVTSLEAQAERAVIDSEDKYQRGSDFETICNQNWDQLEALRVSVKRPIDDYGKFVQSIFKPIQERFEAARKKINAKRLVFFKAEEKRRQDLAEVQRKANEEAAQALAEQAEKTGDAAGAAAILEVATMAVVPQVAMRIGGTNTFGKSTNLAKRWTASVDAPMQLLAAIIAGHVPMSVIEWKQSELNKVATTLKVEKSVWGLKIYQTENLEQR